MTLLKKATDLTQRRRDAEKIKYHLSPFSPAYQRKAGQATKTTDKAQKKAHEASA